MPITEPPLDVLPGPAALIGGERLHSTGGGSYQHVYAATGRPTVEVRLSGADEIDAAVRAARRALPRWRAMPANERRAALFRLAQLVTGHAETLSALQTLETSVPQRFAASFPVAAADFFGYYAGWTDKLAGDLIETWPSRALDYTLPEPYGVVAVIVPWNGAMVSLAQIAGAAIAAGNTVVLKPPERAPFTALRIGELCLEAGLPPGVVNVVPAGPEGGDALVRHPMVDKIHFTGSGATAKKVLAAALDNLTPVGLELGGKSAHLVFADANLGMAARQALAGLVINSGQGCANGTRVLVEAAVYEEVLRLASGRLRHIPMGDPFAAGTSMGPVVDEAACLRILSTIDAAGRAGHGRLVSGGGRLDGELAGGYFVEPTVFADVDNESPLAQCEIFGPVLSFLPFETEREAIELANASPYGLAGYVHTGDVRRAHRVSQALHAGNVWVNGFAGIPPSMPFGGTKQSGHGRVGGAAGIREFTRPKNVWTAL
ncbi:aldehyde dehydrogenase family protein [Amycolatopsis sp. NPDC004079]|uniref:aldehyde dehydrogenase family protein n=1 Tax=Amycolatopsis sp. NPDC004079 TaxID=3154549 RepID=UPI0033BD2DA7